MKTFLFLLLFCMSLKIQAQFATIPLGSSSNAFSGIGDRPLQYSPYSGVIAFIHRQNIQQFPGLNGELRLDVSTNGGISFQNNSLVVNPDSNTRRPSLILTGSATQACQQTAVWTSHLLSPSFGQISGFADTATCTTNSQFSALNLQNNEQISSAESQSGVFVVNKSLSHDSLILYKLNFPNQSIVFEDSIFDATLNYPKIAFSEDGLIGHIIHFGVHEHTFPYFYRLWHWKTMDGGLTWQKSQKILNTFGQGNLFPFEYDISVDYQGNAHVLMSYGEQAIYDDLDSVNYYTGTKYLGVLKHDGSNWSFHFITNLKYLDLNYVGSLSDFGHEPQIARTKSGNKMYAIWIDDSLAQPHISSTRADLMSCSWDVLNPGGASLTVKNLSPGPTFWSGKMFFPKLAPTATENSFGFGLDQLHVAFAEVGPTENDPIQWHYIKNLCLDCPQTNPYAQGMVYHDLNSNGIFDGVDTVLSGWVINNSTGWTASSNPHGIYQISLDFGVLNTLTITSPYFNISPSSYQITPTSSGLQGSNYHFGVQIIPNVQDLRVDIATSGVRPGTSVYSNVTVKNIGTSNVSNARLKVLMPSNFIFQYTIPTHTQQIGDTLVWNNIHLNTLQSLTFQFAYQVPITAVIGSFFQIKAWVEPIASDTTPQNNYDIVTAQIRVSYDPNDKTVNITQLDPNTLDSELKYTIRFQNTGTDTAFTVIIRDTLSNHLDMSTFKILGASHPYSFIIRDHSLLEVFFQNILLPDSFTNEPQSHGFVQYSIKPKSTLQIGDQILNTAHIYFDFNLPVVTNTVLTEMKVTSIFKSNNLESNIYPNPSTGKIKIELNTNELTSLTICDLTGKILIEKSVSNGSEIDLQQLTKGLYLVKLENKMGMKVVKLVRE